MIIIKNKDQIVADWVAKKVGEPIHAPYTALGFSRNEQPSIIVGGVVYNDYNGFNIEITCAMEKGVVCAAILDAVFSYAFETLNCLRVTARTKRSNKAICRMAQRLGFNYEASLKQYFGPNRRDDAILFYIDHASASRWIK